MHPSITSRTAVRRPPVIVLFHVGLAVVASAFLLVGPQPVESHLAEEFSIQQLLTKRFPHRISDDIYLDPCKAGNKTLSYFSSKQTSNRKLHVNCNSLPLTNKPERRIHICLPSKFLGATANDMANIYQQGISFEVIV